MTSRRPYWCSKTMKRRPCWCSKTILWELNSFLIQTPSLVPMNLHRCWPCEWKRSIGSYFNHNYMQIHVTDVISQYVASSQTLYFLFKVRRARVIKYKPQGILDIRQRLCTGYPIRHLRNEKRKGNWCQNVSRNCLWDHFRWRTSQLLANFFLCPL